MRPSPDLGASHIADRGRGGGDLGAAEAAEAVEGLDPVPLAQTPVRRHRIGELARHARDRHREIAQHRVDGGLVGERVRHHDLSGIQPGQEGRQACLPGLRHHEGAGRDVDARNPEHEGGLVDPQS